MTYSVGSKHEVNFFIKMLKNIYFYFSDRFSFTMSDHLSSSDEDMEELLELVEVPKSNAYFEEVLPQFSEEQYMSHFRLTREITE